MNEIRRIRVPGSLNAPVKLTPNDLIAPQTFLTRVLLFYAAEGFGSQQLSELVDRTVGALKVLGELCPVLCGTSDMTNEQVIPMENGGIDLIVQEASPDWKWSMSDLSERGFRAEDMSPDFCARSYIMQPGETFFTLHISRIPGGFVLGCSACHLVVDGSGQFNLLRCVSELSRGVKVSELTMPPNNDRSRLLDDTPCKRLDHPEYYVAPLEQEQKLEQKEEQVASETAAAVTALSDKEGEKADVKASAAAPSSNNPAVSSLPPEVTPSVPSAPASEPSVPSSIPEALSASSSLSEEAGAEVVVEPPFKLAGLGSEVGYLRFTKASVDAAKKLARSTLPANIREPAVLSTHDVVSALLWRAMTRARYPDGADLTTHLGWAGNGRGRMSPPLDPGYTGNLNIFGMTRNTVANVVSAPFGETVAAVRAATAGIDHERVLSALAFCREVVDKQRVSPSFNSFLTQHVCLTNWLQFPLATIDMGYGTPQAVRLPLFESDGFAVFLPPLAQHAHTDALAVFTGLVSEQWKRFRCDRELLSLGVIVE